MRYLLVLIPVILSQTVNATVARKMDRMLVDLIKLGTYFDSPERLYSPSSRPAMIKLTQDMKETFKEASHSDLLKELSLLPSAEILEESLTSIDESLKEKNLNYARLRFNSTRSICLSCHTQLDWKVSGDILERVNELGTELKLSNTDKGDVYSIVRDYTKASQYYLAQLQSKWTLRDSSTEMSILKRILHNYLTGLVDIEAALDFFSVNRTTMNLSRSSSLIVDEWISEMKTWSTVGGKVTKMSVDGFISFYKKRDEIIDDSHDGARDVINHLMLGKLGKELINQSSKEANKAELLYYLGVADRAVDSNFLYSLSDLYFKQCIRNYPKSKYAKLCYSSFEDSVFQSFSGSAGVFIPDDVRTELSELKALLQ